LPIIIHLTREHVINGYSENHLLEHRVVQTSY